MRELLKKEAIVAENKDSKNHVKVLFLRRARNQKIGILLAPSEWEYQNKEK